jgi:lipopolysaccharide transport system ATP-binding protein
MSAVAIRVEHLSKRYTLGQQEAFASLRETLNRMVLAPVRAAGRLLGRVPPRPAAETLWALKDVNFTIAPGEVVGIIGRNGAGKSTLLKILSRITEPTEGQAEIHGRVGSLLEVGTGFHPELTGRENVFLNGSILGMQRAEIKRRFDDIVGFAEVEKFIDTPVKFYSSGMYMRLAFAVAAHLEPEILLVDEVLAVGDAAFQKKCMGKMGDVAQRGRTVLFVSHNMPAVQRLCKTAYLFDKGRIVTSGPAARVVDAYYEMNQDFNPEAPGTRRVEEGQAKYESWQVTSTAGDPYAVFSGDRCQMSFRIHCRREIPRACFGLALYAEDGTLIWAMRNLDYGGETLALSPGRYTLDFVAESLPLRPGQYQIHVSINDLMEGTLDSWYPSPKLTIKAYHESGLPPNWQGILNVRGTFTCQKCVATSEDSH